MQPNAKAIAAGREALRKARLSNLDEELTVIVFYQAMRAGKSDQEDRHEFIPENYNFEAVF